MTYDLFADAILLPAAVVLFFLIWLSCRN